MKKEGHKEDIAGLKKETRKKPNMDEDSENESEDEYSNDSFVVPDNEVSEDAEDSESIANSPKAARKRDPDDDDYDEEDDLMKKEREPKKRLKKIAKKEVNESEEEENQEDNYSDFPNARFVGRPNQMVDRFFGSDNESEGGSDAEIRADEIAQPELNDIFNERDLKRNFETAEDRLIVSTDRPERLQLRFSNRGVPANDELDKEAWWITEKLVLANRWEKDGHSVLQKVMYVLDSIILGNFEVMYLWFYKRKDFSDPKGQVKIDLRLEDLWKIYELDTEWTEIYLKRKEVERLFNELKAYTIIPNALMTFFHKSYNAQGLNALKEWAEYQIKKLMDPTQVLTGEGDRRSVQQAPVPVGEGGRVYTRLMPKVFAREMEKFKASALMEKIALSCHELAENLERRSAVHLPREVGEKIEKTFQDFRRPDVPEFSDDHRILRSIAMFVAGEYLNYPLIRIQLRSLFEKRALLSTVPTEKGKTINVYNEYFPAKRIRNKRPGEIRAELWMLVREASMKGLITVSINVNSKEIVDDLQALTWSSEGNRDEWNFVRIEINQYLVKMYEKEFRETVLRELDEASEARVITDCAATFRKMLFIKPYHSGYTDAEEIRVLAASASDDKAYFVLADTNGALLERLELKQLLRTRKLDDATQRELYEKDANKLKELLSRGQPNAIAVLPKSLRCIFLKMELHNLVEQSWPKEKPKPFIMWSSPLVPYAFGSSPQAAKTYAELSRPFLEALSAARFLQNPLAETLALWDEEDSENLILKMKLHERQGLVPLPRLKRALENVAVEVVNLVGVDVNQAIHNPQVASLLQFVCGLGPRKARSLVEKLAKVDGVGTRKELYDFLKKTVFVNSIGFLKVNGRANPHASDAEFQRCEWLDITRIHPDNYALAEKIARDASENPPPDTNKIVLGILRNPEPLKALELEEYAEFLEKKKDLKNMIYVIDFIVSEFVRPFAEMRADFPTKQEREDIFYQLTNENAYSFREEGLITVKVLTVDENGLRICTPTNVLGQVPRSLCDVDAQREELRNFFQPGQSIKARIKGINFETQKIRLSVTRDDLRSHKLFLVRNGVLSRLGLEDGVDFRIVAEEDYPLMASERRKEGVFVSRRVTHPMFRNIGYQPARDMLEKKAPGSFVFRPAANSPDCINLTWMIAEQQFLNLQIREAPKAPGQEISSHLTLDRQIFDSLDDIIARYIRPINQQVSKIIENEKFQKKSYPLIKANLIEIYDSNPDLIPYFFSFWFKLPQYLVLSYILNKNSIINELIKIKPNGLYFHDITFPNLMALIRYFKDNSKTDEYQRFVASTLPFALTDDPEEVADQPKDEVFRKRERPKEEYRRNVKEEYQYRPDDVKRVKRESDGVKMEPRAHNSYSRRPRDEVKSEYMD